MSKRRFASLKKSELNKSVDQPCAAGYSKHIKLFHFLFQEYGSLEFIMDIAGSALDFMGRFFIKKKRYQSILVILRYGIPAAVLISDFISKVNKFRQIKSGKNTVSNESTEKFKQLFEYSDSNIVVDNYPFMLGSEVTQWLLQRPKTISFKILGYHHYEDLQNVADTYKEDDTILITALEMDDVKFAWMLRMYRSSEGDLYVRFSDIYTTMGNIHLIPELKGRVFREFIQHFDIVSNVLLLSSSGLNVYPRQEIVENPEHFDIQGLSTEIQKVLKRKKKRGFVFVGIPGTGKSTIIHCLESRVTEYPIVYLSSNCFVSAFAVKETFNTLSYIQPCLAIIEDLDSCELKDKRQALGEFLEQIDDVDNKLNIVFIATVNDTSLVHYSLINRPGRFDEVIMVSTPQSITEVYGILECRYYKNKRVDPSITEEFISFSDIDENLLKDILEKGYTQADICEIVEKALLIGDSFTNQTCLESVENLERSKKALQECNFGGTDPFNYSDEIPTEDCKVETPDYRAVVSS